MRYVERQRVRCVSPVSEEDSSSAESGSKLQADRIPKSIKEDDSLISKTSYGSKVSSFGGAKPKDTSKISPDKQKNKTSTSISKYVLKSSPISQTKSPSKAKTKSPAPRVRAVIKSDHKEEVKKPSKKRQAPQPPGSGKTSILAKAAYWDSRIEEGLTSDDTSIDNFPMEVEIK